MFHSQEKRKESSHEIVPGDPKLRRLVLIGLVLLVCAGILGLHRFQEALDGIKELFAHDPHQARERLRALIMVFMSVHVILTTSGSVYLVSLGIRCMRAGRYPPKGMRVLKDTRVVSGSRVGLLSTLLILVGILLLASNALIWRLVSYLEELGRQV
jgi:hypothetical protein